MRESAEKSAGDDATRAEGSRDGRGAHMAARVVLVLVAMAMVIAAWALSPGLLTRTIEARLGADQRWRVDWTTGTRESGAWLDAQITGPDARVGIAAGAERIQIRRFAMRESGNEAVAFEGALVERVGGVPIRRIALREGMTDVGARDDLVLVLRVGASVIVMASMAATLRLLQGVGRRQRARGDEVCNTRSPVARTGGAVAWSLGAVPVGVIAGWTLVSPTMMCPDSVDYVVNAMRLLETGSFAHFDGWRTPGYSVVLLAMLAFGAHVATAAGVLNAAMVIAAMLLGAGACRRIVLEATGRATHATWASVAVMWVIGLDPWVLLWTRHVMPECASMLVVAVVVRVLVEMAVCKEGPEGTAAPPTRLRALRSIAIGAALGVFIGGACYLRGNFQLLVVCVPVCLGVCVLARGGGFGRAMMVGGACAACGVGMLVPWVVRTHTRTGEWNFTTGGPFARALFAHETGLMDWNQASAFDVDHMVRLARMRDAGTLGAYPFVHEMNTGMLAGMGDPGLPQLVNTDRRARVMVDESLSRRPAMRSVLALKAMSTQLDVWAFGVPGYRENAYWASALRGAGDDAQGPTGGDNQWADPASQTHLPGEMVARAHARTTRSIEAYRTSAWARGFGAWWTGGGAVRRVVAWAGVLGVLGVAAGLVRAVVMRGRGSVPRREDAGWVRGAVCVMLIAGLIAAHGAAIAWVVLTGLDRYAVAMIPASAVVAVAAWCVCLSGCGVRGFGGGSRSGPGERQGDAERRSTR